MYTVYRISYYTNFRKKYKQQYAHMKFVHFISCMQFVHAIREIWHFLQYFILIMSHIYGFLLGSFIINMFWNPFKKIGVKETLQMICSTSDKEYILKIYF